MGSDDLSLQSHDTNGEGTEEDLVRAKHEALLEEHGYAKATEQGQQMSDRQPEAARVLVRPTDKQPAPRVPDGFIAVTETISEPYTNTGWAKDVIHDRTGIAMVFVPAGEFMMGSPAGELGSDRDEHPQHLVRISRPFYMGTSEVTQAEWQRMMGTNPAQFQGANNPVEQVSWKDCQRFVQKASGGLRLPTEAEWEYACRAGTTTRFYVGDTDDDLGAAGWHVGNSGLKTHSVRGKQPNAWGLYDMHGNVWEWCHDWYDENAYTGSVSRDPTGPRSGTARVNRGGSWRDPARGSRSANRGRSDPAHQSSGAIGLRVVKSLP